MGYSISVLGRSEGGPGATMYGLWLSIRCKFFAGDSGFAPL